MAHPVHFETKGITRICEFALISMSFRFFRLTNELNKKRDTIMLRLRLLIDRTLPIGVFTLLLMNPVFVHPQVVSGDTLEEVVVTAEKRSENVQSVPLSMTNFGSVALEQKAITNFFDYATKVPNLAFAPTGDGVANARTIAIRGISGANVTGFYIDDTPLPDSLDPRVLDIDHIEVLRGPQGTLYGARSMGGTVRIITKQADFDNFGLTVHSGVSDTARTVHANYTTDAVVNLPLIKDRLALRISGFYDDQAGYFTRSYCTDPTSVAITCLPLSNTNLTTVKNVAALASYGGAASLILKVTDDLTVTTRIMTQRSDFNGFPMADVYSTPGNGYGYPVPSSNLYTLPPLLPRSFNQSRLFNVPEGGYDNWDLGSVTVKWQTGVGELVSSTAYFYREVNETEDQSELTWAGITLPFGGSPQPTSISEAKANHRFAQELRFASSLTGPTQFVVGAFYSATRNELFNPSPSTVPGLDSTFLGPAGGQVTPGYANLIFLQDYHTSIQEPAVFGEISFQASEALKLTAGLRWYQVKTTFNGFEEGLVTGGGPAIVSPNESLTERGVTPKLEADYHLTKDQMVYVNVAKGFRPGGFVPSVPPGASGTATDCAAALHQQDPQLTLADTRSYRSDSLWNYELGTKTSWFDRRLTVNAAAFDIRWKNIQQQDLLGCGFPFTANAGAAESKGGELELHALATQALEVSAGVGYQDAKITQTGPTSPQAVGSPVYQVPDWTANGSMTYTAPLTSVWMLVSDLDYAYIGRSFSGNNSPSNPRERPSYRLLDGRFSITNGNLQFALVGKNLTNEAADLSDSISIAAELPGRPRIFVNQPRTIGLEFRFHY